MMEHHSNLVPWQLLAEERGAGSTHVRAHRRRPARHGPPATSCWRASRSWSRSRTSPTASARSTTSPRSSAGRTPPARSSWSTARRACRTCRSTCRRSTATSSPSPGTRCSARWASGVALRQARAAGGDAAVHGRRQHDPQGRARAARPGPTSRPGSRPAPRRSATRSASAWRSST